MVVVQRGGCQFAVKLSNIAQAGARVALIYNSPGLAMIPALSVGSSGLLAAAALTLDAGQQVSLHAMLTEHGAHFRVPCAAAIVLQCRPNYQDYVPVRPNRPRNRQRTGWRR